MRLMNKTNDQNIEQIVRLMQADKSFDAPTDAIQWSKNIFRARVAEPKKSIVEKVLAVLQMDLSPNRAAFGERSASATQARQMLFQAGETGIDLRIKQTEQGFNVQGQILGEDFANCTIKLGEFATTANELSEFKFTNVPVGKYDLILRNETSEIVVKEIGIE